MCYKLNIQASSENYPVVRELLQKYGFFQENENKGYFISENGHSIEILPSDNVVGKLKICISKKSENPNTESIEKTLVLDRTSPNDETFEEFLHEKFGKLEKAVNN